jgi:radical SAM protein with 4Fe4S-binding SPASM domain
MPTARILDLLDQAAALGFRECVAFYHYSEPLLDKRHLMLAREARKRGMKPYIHTNGDLLKDDDRLRDEVMNAYTSIVVGLYDYRTNEELEEARQFWRHRLAGVDVKFSPIGLSGAQSGHSVGIPRALVPSDARMAVPDLLYPNAPCHRPLIRMLIQYDGDVCNCCEDTYGAFNLGNAFQSSMESLWFSERHVQVVRDLVAGRREKYALCRNCPQSPTGPAPNGARIDIRPRRLAAASDPRPDAGHEIGLREETLP